MNASNSIKITRNTVFLYIRMLISMVVSLYTSRVVLQTLGVVDFGIYGVVGSVVSFFSFITASMSGATSRFLTIEIGRNDKERLSLVFNMSFYQYCFFALFLFFVIEAVGIWVVNSMLNIPTERMSAANWTFQLSVMAMLVLIIQIPYRAMIIAHEDIGAYSILEIINVFLKLIIVYLLVMGDVDKLVLYSFLMLMVSVLITVLYAFFSHNEYKACNFKRVWDKPLFRQMAVFSAWDLYGNMSNMARTQGVAVLLNIFFGPIMNAASTVATQAGAAVMNFASNVTTAVKPQIIKYYAQSNYPAMSELMHFSVKINFLILFLFSVPLLFEMEYVMGLWLSVIPAYAVAFCSLILIFNFFANASNIIVTGVHATGNIKRMSIINGSLYLSVIPLSYIGFKCGFPAWMPFLVNILAVIAGMSSNAYIVSRRIPDFSILEFIVNDVGKCIFVFIFTCLAVYAISVWVGQGIIRLLLVTIVSSIILATVGMWYLLSKNEFILIKKSIKVIWRKL